VIPSAYSSTARPSARGREIDLNVKDVLLANRLHLHFAEAEQGPFLFHKVLPSDHGPAHGAFGGSAARVG